MTRYEQLTPWRQVGEQRDKNFAAVTLMAKEPSIVVVHPSFPLKPEDFAAYIRAKIAALAKIIQQTGATANY